MAKLSRFSPSRADNLQQSQTNERLSSSLDSLTPAAVYGVTTEANVRVTAGAVQRCSPRAGGMNVVIPTASASNFNQQIVLFVENALGPLTVRAASGTVDGGTRISVGAGSTTLLALRSNGTSGWVTMRDGGRQHFTSAQDVSSTGAFDVTLEDGADRLVFTGASPTINSISGGSEIGRLVLVYFNGTGVARFKHSTAGPSGNESRMFNPDNTDGLLTPRGSFILQGNGSAGWRTLDWTANTGGNSSQLVLTGITGNQGTVDISSLACGGSLFVSAPTGDWQIEGFSGNNNAGFWFNLLVSNSTFIGTIFDEDGTPSAGNRIRCQNALNVVGTRIQAIFFYNGPSGSNKWSCVSAPTVPAGRLLRRTILTTGTAATFNHIAGATTCILKGIGGGGAAGGVGAVAGSAGAGGASGTWGERLFAIVAATSTYTIGAAGVGAAGTGGTGGATLWTHNAVVTTLPGGLGGTSLAGAATVAMSFGGSPGAAATNADWNSAGMPGGTARRTAAATTPCFGGRGGSSPYGSGGWEGETAGASSNGVIGTGFGSGGAGRANGTTATAANGVNGTGGMWIVEEYS